MVTDLIITALFLILIARVAWMFHRIDQALDRLIVAVGKQGD